MSLSTDEPTKLALCTRENQQRLNKIARGQLKNMDVKILARLCLALRLTGEEAIPAAPVHRVYRELIQPYPQKRNRLYGIGPGTGDYFG